MKKIKATIERFEGEKALLRSGDEEIVFPTKILGDHQVGEELSILVANEKEDTENANAVARALVTDLFKQT